MSQREFEALAREAVQCRDCFHDLSVETPVIDVAQPRWVGPLYWSSQPRVAIIALNPGSGEFRADSADARFRSLLISFQRGTGSLAPVLEHQAHDIPNWGRGRFASFYLHGLGLRLDEIALANVAWCATRGNKYPAPMLNRCFRRHTERLLRLLSPDVVLLSGAPTHRFAAPLGRALPRARIVRTLHYAHREGHATQAAETEKIRATIAQATGRLTSGCN